MMQRMVCDVAARKAAAATSVRRIARRPPHVCAAVLMQQRLSSSQAPPPPPTQGQQAKAMDSGAPELDAKAAEQVRLAQDIGEQAFGENTEILKQVGYRGLRAFVVCAIGLGAFMWAMKKKKKELAASEAAQAEDDEDPTQRYLEEMRSLGFDVDTLEEELEQERVEKLAASQKSKPASS